MTSRTSDTCHIPAVPINRLPDHAALALTVIIQHLLTGRALDSVGNSSVAVQRGTDALHEYGYLFREAAGVRAHATVHDIVKWMQGDNAISKPRSIAKRSAGTLSGSKDHDQ